MNRRKASPELDQQNEGRLLIGSLGFVRLFRNNTGTLLDSRGVPVTYGLANGSADTIGLVAPHGRFLSIEWKEPGWKPISMPADYNNPDVRLSRDQEKHRDQLNWRDMVRKLCGVAGFADGLEPALELVYEATFPAGEIVNILIRNHWIDMTLSEFRAKQTERHDRRNKRRG